MSHIETQKSKNPSDSWMVSTTHTYDAYEQATSVKGWDIEYEQMSSGGFSGKASDIHFLDTQIFRENFNKSVYQCGSCDPDRRAFGIFFSIEGNANFFGQKSKPTDMCVLRGGERMDFVTPEKIDMVGITINNQVLDDYFENVAHFDINSSLNNKHIVPETNSLRHLRSFLETLTTMLQISPESLKHEELQRYLQDSILSGLTETLQYAEASNKTRPSYIVRRNVVDRAKAFINEHTEKPVTIEELCKAVGASQRTLQYCFEDVLMTNPVQYLRKMRLNGVRRDLKSYSGKHVSVQDVAAKWGFWHLSRLARDYRELFGELPSETIKLTAKL